MKSILKYHFFYNLYQNLIGSGSFLKRYVETFILPEIRDKNSVKIIDIGCGTGNIVPYIPHNCEYTGVDVSENYIKYLKKKYSHKKNINFIKQNVKEPLSFNEKYDIIISEALIASLNDTNFELLLTEMKNFLKKGGKIVISDMNYKESHCAFEKFLLKNERGCYIRGQDDYKRIIEKYFTIEKTTEINKVYWFPYHKIAFECREKM